MNAKESRKNTIQNIVNQVSQQIYNDGVLRGCTSINYRFNTTDETIINDIIKCLRDEDYNVQRQENHFKQYITISW